MAMHRKEPEIHFAQRIYQVEGSFSGDLEVVMKHIQRDACNLEHHYQRKVVAFSQHHVAGCVQWVAKLETATQEAERQRKFLQESEKQAIVTELTQKPKRLEHTHIVDMDAILQLQSKPENIVSKAQIEETVFSCELNELHDRLQKNLKDKDTLLLQTENKAAKLELLDDFRRQHDEILPFIEKQQQERCDLVKRFRRKIQDMECLFCQAMEDFHNEYLELQGIVVELEEKLKNSISIALKQEEQCVALFAERDNLARKAHQMLCARGSITGQTMNDQIIQDLSLPDFSIEFVVEPQDNVMAEQPRGLRALVKENSPIAQHEKFKRPLFPQEEDAGDFENPEHAIAQMLKIVIGENLSCTGGNKTGDTQMVKDDHFTDTSRTEETDDPYSYEPLFVDIPEKTESTTKNTASFDFDILGVTCTEGSTEIGRFVDSIVSTRSCIEETKSLVGGELCENSAETSNKTFAFIINNIMTEDSVWPKGAEVCNFTDSEITAENNGEYHEGTQNSELYSGKFSKNTVAMADEEVPRWSSDDFNPVRMLVKNGTICISTDLVQHDSHTARGIEGASISKNTTDPNQFVVRITQADVSYHEEPGLEMQERIEEDTTTIVQTGYSCTTTSQHEALATEPMLQKEQEDTELGEYLRTIEILELQVMAVQFKYQSHLLELLQEQYKSTVKQNLSLQNQLVNMQQCNDKLELMLDLNKGKPLTNQTVLEEIHDLRMDLNALAGYAIELEIKVLEFVELQAQYEKCVHENVQLAQQKMKLERRVEHLESKIHTVQEFQEQQSSLLKHIINMHKENARLSMVVHDQEHLDKMLLTLHKEAESISVDSSDDSFKDFSFQLGVKVFSLCEQGDLEFEKQNPCLQSAVTHLQEKFLRINKKIQEHRYHIMPISSWLTRKDILPSQQNLLACCPYSC